MSCRLPLMNVIFDVLLVEPISHVYPSGCAWMTASVPITPPAPGLFSTVIVTLKAGLILSTTIRVTTSPTPPAGYGTTTRMGRCGNRSWAPAAAADAAIRQAAVPRRMAVIRGGLCSMGLRMSSVVNATPRAEVAHATHDREPAAPCGPLFRCADHPCFFAEYDPGLGGIQRQAQPRIAPIGPLNSLEARDAAEPSERAAAGARARFRRRDIEGV